jgi:hypothetical protein
MREKGRKTIAEELGLKGPSPSPLNIGGRGKPTLANELGLTPPKAGTMRPTTNITLKIYPSGRTEDELRRILMDDSKNIRENTGVKLVQVYYSRHEEKKDGCRQGYRRHDIQLLDGRRVFYTEISAYGDEQRQAFNELYANDPFGREHSEKYPDSIYLGIGYKDTVLFHPYVVRDEDHYSPVPMKMTPEMAATIRNHTPPEALLGHAPLDEAGQVKDEPNEPKRRKVRVQRRGSEG